MHRIAHVCAYRLCPLAAALHDLAATTDQRGAGMMFGCTVMVRYSMRQQIAQRQPQYSRG